MLEAWPSSRTWAVTAFARSLRTETSWGIGDYADVGRHVSWIKSVGGGGLFLGPTCLTRSWNPLNPSPYSPSSRALSDVDLISVPDVAGWEDIPTKTRQGLLSQAREYEQSDLIRLAEVSALKREALELIFEERRPDVARLVRRRFDAVERQRLGYSALFEALTERYGPEWRTWPRGLRRPQSAFAAVQPEAILLRAAFHEWCQTICADQQVRARDAGVPIVADIPVGTPADSVDAWLYQDVLDFDFELGAPGDYFNSNGHRWGLAPFTPEGLQSVDFDPVRSALVHALRGAAGFRIDHALGLIRQFWIPRDGEIRHGKYVGQPTEALIRTIVETAASGRALVVMEELGTRPPEGVHALRGQGFLRLEVVSSEEFSTLDESSVGALTTHDLPTIAGLARCAGVDSATAPSSGHASAWRRITDLSGVPPESKVDGILPKAYRALARSACPIVLVPLDDALGVIDQLNRPGSTSSEYPNFLRRLPGLDDLRVDDGLGSVLHEVHEERP